MELNYSPELIHDLIQIREFIEVKNPVAAKRIAGEQLTGIGKLKVFPRMGLPAGCAPDPEVIRDLFVGQYTVRYLAGSQDVFVLRV